jgi:hypothetical protein
MYMAMQLLPELGAASQYATKHKLQGLLRCTALHRSCCMATYAALYVCEQSTLALPRLAYAIYVFQRGLVELLKLRMLFKLYSNS